MLTVVSGLGVRHPELACSLSPGRILSEGTQHLSDPFSRQQVGLQSLGLYPLSGSMDDGPGCRHSWKFRLKLLMYNFQGQSVAPTLSYFRPHGRSSPPARDHGDTHRDQVKEDAPSGAKEWGEMLGVWPWWGQRSRQPALCGWQQALLRVLWWHRDLFLSALPWPQGALVRRGCSGACFCRGRRPVREALRSAVSASWVPTEPWGMGRQARGRSWLADKLFRQFSEPTLTHCCPEGPVFFHSSLCVMKMALGRPEVAPSLLRWFEGGDPQLHGHE